MHEQGYSDAQIKEQLIKSGWEYSVVDAYFQKNTSKPKIQKKVGKSGKIGKFRGSKMVVRASWNLLKQDKEAMWFPILSVITNFLFLILIFILFFFTVAGGTLEGLGIYMENETASIINYAFLFVIYFTIFFIVSFFEIGIVALAHGRVSGKDLTFKDGLKFASSRIGKIFIWSLLSASIGIILRIIFERSRLLIKIVALIIGAAWSITTYFIIPVIAIEDLSIKESFKKSVFVIKKTWGESIIVNIGVSLFFGLLGFAGFLVFVLSIFMANSGLVMIVTGILLVIYLFTLTVISATLSTIFKYVLYQYASTGVVPPGFSPELLNNAFKKRK